MTVTQSTFGTMQPMIEQPPVETPVVETPTPAASAEPETPVITPEVPVTPEPEQPVITPSENDGTDFSLDFEQENTAQTTETPAQPTPAAVDWKKAVAENKDAVLAELGLSSFALEMDKHIKGGGKPIDYLMAKAIDYNTVSDEKLLKDKLAEEYPNLQPSQIDLMYRRKYVPDVNATEEDEQFLDATMKADAYKIRQQKINEQNGFKIADAMPMQTDEGYEAYKKAVADQQAQAQENVNFYKNHSATKSLNESKRVTINFEDGVPAFNFKIDKPELITNALTDDGAIMSKLLSAKSGEPDVAKEQLVTLFAFNPQKFIQTIFNYGKQQGVHQKLVNENQNAARPNAPVLPMSPDTKPVYKQSTFGQTMSS